MAKIIFENLRFENATEIAKDNWELSEGRPLTQKEAQELFKDLLDRLAEVLQDENLEDYLQEYAEEKTNGKSVGVKWNIKTEENPHSEVGLPSMFCSGNPRPSVWENITGNKAKIERAINQHYTVMLLFPESNEAYAGWILAEYLEDQEVWFADVASWGGEVGTGKVSFEHRPDPLGGNEDLQNLLSEENPGEIWVETTKER